MDSIIEKLSDIENTAEAIVEHAEARSMRSRRRFRQRETSLTRIWRPGRRRGWMRYGQRRKRRWIRSWRSNGRRTARQLTI